MERKKSQFGKKPQTNKAVLVKDRFNKASLMLMLCALLSAGITLYGKINTKNYLKKM